jgi:hypothetical protein
MRRRECSITKKPYSSLNGGHGKEIHGGNRLAMVGEEGLPALASITASSEPLPISGYRAFEAKLLQFAMNLRCAPARVLNSQAADETPHLRAHLRSPPCGRDRHRQ